MTTLSQGAPPAPATELQRFVDARQRAAAFFFTGQEYPLFRSHVISLHDEIRGRTFEELKAGKGAFTSALNPFKSLEQLVSASVEALAAAMRFIVEEYEMSYDESLPHAVAFVGQTTGPLVSRLDPDKLGQYNRELSVAIEYGRRLLTRYRGLSPAAAGDLVERLVYGYPSHEYIVDFQELEELGFDVSLFPEGPEREAAAGLLPVAEKGSRIVQIIEPTPSAPAPTATSVDEALASVTGGGEPMQNGGET